jgi:hypothetical protein
MSASDVEASKTVLELESYPGADAVVEARVESSNMTKNGEEQNASNDTANGVEVSKLTSVFLSFQITSRPFTGWFNVLTMHKSGDTAYHRLKGSKMTATDAVPQESGDTASGAGVSITMSSMKIRLAFQHSLINTRFFLSLFFNGSAENSQKSPPHWGRLEYAIFSTGIVTRHVYSLCMEFYAFFLRDYSMKCQIGYLIIILTLSILILRSTSRLGSVGSDI